MEMIYNSDAFCVVRFEVPYSDTTRATTQDATQATTQATTQDAAGKAPPATQSLARGGYEIVDKWGQKEIFIDGAMAAHFQNKVQALIDSSPSVEEIDDYLEQFSSIMQQPVALH
jgi:hypothetical protein